MACSFGENEINAISEIARFYCWRFKDCGDRLVVYRCSASRSYSCEIRSIGSVVAFPDSFVVCFDLWLSDKIGFNGDSLDSLFRSYFFKDSEKMFLDIIDFVKKGNSVLDSLYQDFEQLKLW